MSAALPASKPGLQCNHLLKEGLVLDGNHLLEGAQQHQWGSGALYETMLRDLKKGILCRSSQREWKAGLDVTSHPSDRMTVCVVLLDIATEPLWKGKFCMAF
jgi:hypothetical protein